MYACRQVYACKPNGRFFRHKSNLMHSFNLHIFWWMYKVYIKNSCKSHRNKAVFYTENAWTDTSEIEKLKIKFTLTWCRCFNSLHDVFPSQKNISMFEKTTRRFNYKPKLCQNSALSLNGTHLNIPSTECVTLYRAAAAQAHTGWTILMRGRSLLR